ncbi:MAG: GWxTD domain-containing protein [Candidatus Aminicenantales bacterium]
MKKKPIIILLIFFLVLPLCGQEAKKLKVKDLPPRYRTWLEEEVVYIITPGEREVFLQLQTDRERDLFIEAFWKQRDPTPGTPENEYYKDHYARINYANHFFGRATPKPGWKTDRGRIYIILGPPNDIQRIEGKTQVYNSEIWFYQDKTYLGLPPGFNLVFYQESFTGEYKLYSPVKDGPQALLTSYYGDPLDYVAAYDQLKEFSAELAEVSMSLIPGETSPVLGQPSMASDLLLQKVETTPQRQFEDIYARKFLQFKDIVEVEYSTNYIASRSLVTVVKEPTGMYFVHYAIEPKRLSVNEHENKYTTLLRVNGTVSDEDGRRVYQFEKTIPLEIDSSKIRELSLKPFDFHDMFPLIPGRYKFSVLVKNEASKEFTSIERDLLIPGNDKTLQMAAFFLGYKAVRVGEEELKSKLKPFRVGHYQVYFQPNRVFLSSDTLVVVFQLHGLNPSLKERGEIRYTFFRMGEELRTFTRKVSDYPELPNIVQEFPLRDFPPDLYRVQASLMVDGKEVLFDSRDFEITFRTSLSRPWIYSKILPDAQDPIYSHVVGIQLFNRGRYEEARHWLEEAYQNMPHSVDSALNLARLYMTLSEYDKVEKVLFPFLNEPKPNFETYLLIARAYQSLGKLEKAIDILKQALSHFGVSTHILNLLGESYFQLGLPEEALKAWEKSLELDSNQPKIKENVEVLRGRKK